MHAYSRHSIKIRWKSTDNELEKAYIIFERWVLLSLKTNVNVHVIELIWALPFLKTCQPIIFEKRKYISQYKYSKETVFLWSCLTLTQLSNKYILILSSDEIIGGKKTIVFLPLGVLFFIVNKKKIRVLLFAQGNSMLWHTQSWEATFRECLGAHFRDPNLMFCGQVRTVPARTTSSYT